MNTGGSLKSFLKKPLDISILVYLSNYLKTSFKRYRIKKRIRSRRFIACLQNGTEELKLDVCGGRFPYRESYLNVDIQKKLPEVDMIADIRKKIPVPDGSVAEIFSCGTLEHFCLSEVRNILKEFYRVLKPQGSLIIGVPSLKKICDIYISGEVDFEAVNRYLYGAQKTKYDFHKNIFDFENIKRYLLEAGFFEIKEEVYDLPFHISKYMMKIVCKKV